MKQLNKEEKNEKEINNYTVYMHVNKINNKKYIGITMQKPENRWSKGNHYKSSPHFYSSIKKYGWDGFEHLILFENLSAKDAKNKEIELIAEYKSINKEYGYNCTIGGEGATGHKHTKEAIEKMRIASTGNVPSLETREKMRKTMTGRIMNAEWKQRISDSHKGDKNPSAKAVVQLDSNYKLIKEYSCARYAEKELGINVVNISQVCIGTGKSAGGYIFMFKEDYDNKKSTLINKSVNIKPYRIPVIQMSLDGEEIFTFASVNEASKQLNIDHKGISNVCKLKQKTSGGFKWKYAC